MPPRRGGRDPHAGAAPGVGPRRGGADHRRPYARAVTGPSAITPGRSTPAGGSRRRWWSQTRSSTRPRPRSTRRSGTGSSARSRTSRPWPARAIPDGRSGWTGTKSPSSAATASSTAGPRSSAPRSTSPAGAPHTRAPSSWEPCRRVSPGSSTSPCARLRARDGDLDPVVLGGLPARRRPCRLPDGRRPRDRGARLRNRVRPGRRRDRRSREPIRAGGQAPGVRAGGHRRLRRVRAICS